MWPTDTSANANDTKAAGMFECGGTFLILKFVAWQLRTRSTEYQECVVLAVLASTDCRTTNSCQPPTLFSLALGRSLQIRPVDLTSQSVLSICKPSRAPRPRAFDPSTPPPAADALVVADTTFCGFGNDTSTASTNGTDNSWRGLRLLHNAASGGSGSGGGWSLPPKSGLRFDLSPRRSGQRRCCWSSNQARHVLAAVQSVQ